MLLPAEPALGGMWHLSPQACQVIDVESLVHQQEQVPEYPPESAAAVAQQERNLAACSFVVAKVICSRLFAVSPPALG